MDNCTHYGQYAEMYTGSDKYLNQKCIKKETPCAFGRPILVRPDLAISDKHVSYLCLSECLASLGLFVAERSHEVILAQDSNWNSIKGGEDDITDEIRDQYYNRWSFRN